MKLLGSVVRKLESDNVKELVGSVVKALVEGKSSMRDQLKLQREQFQTAIKKCVKELPENEGKGSGIAIVQNLCKVNSLFVAAFCTVKANPFIGPKKSRY